MKRLFSLAACCSLLAFAGLALDLPLNQHPNSTDWQQIIAADLSNTTSPAGIWSMKDGILAASEDQNLWTKERYGDCMIDLEFKFEPGANSGVFIYNSDQKSWMPTSVEIQICDDAAKQWQAKPANWRCGAFFGHQAARKSAVKPAGEWNRMTITARGPKISVLLNAEIVNEIDLNQWKDGKLNPDGSEKPKWLQGKPWTELPKKGRIGFQGRHAGAGIQFRNIKILPL